VDALLLNPLFALGLILITGCLAGQAAHYFGMPRISGYILTGLILSPSISGILQPAQVYSLFGFTSQMALAIIAYSIGGSLQTGKLRELGGPILWIVLAEGVGAFVFTCLAVLAARAFLPFAFNGNDLMLAAVILLLGGISVATAPAASMAIVHELRARGPLTTTLLGVVALDDALCILIFSAALTAAGHLTGTSEANYAVLLMGVVEVCGSLVLGLLGGFLLSRALSPGKRADANLLFILGAIFLVSSLADNFGFSPLLANMMMGFFIINKIPHADDLFHQLDLMEELIFCLFFSLAAAHFNLAVLISSATLAVILLVGRFTGKLIGAYLGGIFSGAPPQVAKFLGLTLLPQAGVALGLIFLARPMMPPEIFDLMLSAMLASIILNEIISPPLVKWALTKAGEANPEE
jgi:Kef-type K+ transport system membrane component KefB